MLATKPPFWAQELWNPSQPAAVLLKATKLGQHVLLHLAQLSQAVTALFLHHHHSPGFRDPCHSTHGSFPALTQAALESAS